MGRMTREARKKEAKAFKKRNQVLWGYFFTFPFIAAFFLFFFVPIVSTFIYGFYEYYTVGLLEIEPTFIGLKNYSSLIDGDFLRCALNTILLWIGYFIPQIVISAFLAAWLTDAKMLLKSRELVKVVIYMPGMIMASAWAVLTFTLFSNSGPVNQFLMGLKITESPIEFFSSVKGTRFLICMLMFLMNLGNTTLMLVTSVAAIPKNRIESALLDGCGYIGSYFHVVLPSIRPVMVYILITSIITGLQMFDIPQVITHGNGNPNRTSMTLIMYLNRYITSNNYGMAAALSVCIFLISSILCFLVYNLTKGENLYSVSKRKGSVYDV